MHPAAGKPGRSSIVRASTRATAKKKPEAASKIRRRGSAFISFDVVGKSLESQVYFLFEIERRGGRLVDALLASRGRRAPLDARRSA